jgi:hypothetical protein
MPGHTCDELGDDTGIAGRRLLVSGTHTSNFLRSWLCRCAEMTLMTNVRPVCAGVSAVLDAGASLSLSLDKVATLTKRLSLAAPEPTFPAKTFFGTTCDLQEWRAWEVHRKRCVAPRCWRVRSVSRTHMHTCRVRMDVRGCVHVRARRSVDIHAGALCPCDERYLLAGGSKNERVHGRTL